MKKTFAICIIVSFVIAGFAFGDTASLPPTDDAFTKQDDPDDNYGSSDVLYVGYSGGWSNSLLKFDLSPYTGATINDAYIRLYVYSHYGDFPTDLVRIAMNSADWNEGTVTWNNRPGFSDMINLSAPGTYGWWHIYVTDWIQDMVDGIEPNYGFQIYQNDTDYALFLMYSKENTTNRPTLEIDYSMVGLESTTFGRIKASFQ